MTRIPWTVAALVAVTLASTALAGPYPSPPPSFVRTLPAKNTEQGYGPVQGANSRPVLVIYAKYDDVSAPSNQDAAFVNRRYFGGFPSVDDYLRVNSSGKLHIAPAAEPEGTPNDGVVTVDVGNAAAFRALSAADQDKVLLQKAHDAGVRFGQFDRNNDGKVTDDELGVVGYIVARPPNETQCGQTNGTSALTLDEKNLGSLKIAGTVTDTNLLTQIHELGHQMLDTRDLYGFGAGSFDLYGPTCYANERYFEFNAWQKLNLGWINPTVVTRDGFYDVRRADTSGDAFILYDADRGTNDFFIVENREPTPLTYDEDASDRGLAIWRADSRISLDNGVDVPRAIELVRPDGTTINGCNDDDLDGKNDEDPVDGADNDGDGRTDEDPPNSPGCYGGSDTDAWDASDSRTASFRTMGRPWRDGTPSRVAVRAIGAAGETMRVYFDVRGPGVLVDPSPDTKDVYMAQSSTISFPVMNTGEATDTFRFTFTGLPSGWSASTDTQSLGAGAAGVANVQLTIPADTPAQVYELQAVGTSASDASVTSSSTLTVRVLKRPTGLVYTGSVAADYSDPAAVSATLTDGLTGAALAGKTVSFTIGTQSTSSQTGSTGVASGTIVLDQPAASTFVETSFAGDGTFDASSDSDPFTIHKETLTYEYTGDRLRSLGSSPTLAAVATQQSDGYPGDITLADAAFVLAPTLTATPFTYSTGVGGDGSASVTAVGLTADVWTVTVSVSAANGYWQGSSPPAELVLFDPAGRSTGDAAGVDSSGSRIGITFDAQYDITKPKGSASLRFSGGMFSGKSLAWIVQVGNQAITQYVGQLNRTSATLRLRVADNAEPGRPDTFRALIAGYDSGLVAVTSGNIQTH